MVQSPGITSEQVTLVDVSIIERKTFQLSIVHREKIVQITYFLLQMLPTATMYF